MTQPVVFISYSHKDEAEKEQLLAHLQVVERTGSITVWSDDRLGAGADWETGIDQAIAQARVALLLVSANFLTSAFILGKEVPPLLKRRQEEGLIVFPVIAKPCAWQTVDWLRRINVRPKNGRPIWGGPAPRVDQDLAEIAREVAALVKNPAPAATGLATPPGSTAAPSAGPAPAVDISGNVMIGRQVVNIWRGGVRLARNWLWGEQRFDVKPEPAPPASKQKPSEPDE
ncbi:MAG: toll/interleukin-1 receptor domain-containing protein [Chloroflexota bacterium]